MMAPKARMLLVLGALIGCRTEEAISARETTTTAVAPKPDLQTAVKRYLDAQMLVDQEKLFAEIPFADASLEERRAVARELMDRAGGDGDLAGWVSGNRLGVVLAKLGEAGDEKVPEITSRLTALFARDPEGEEDTAIGHLSGMLQAMGTRGKAAVPEMQKALGGAVLGDRRLGARVDRARERESRSMAR